MFQVVVEVCVGVGVAELVMVVVPFRLSVVASKSCFPFTSFVGIETSCRILRTSLLCRPDAPRFEKTAHRCSQDAFRSEQSFRLRHPLALSIDYCYLLPNSR